MKERMNGKSMFSSLLFRDDCNYRDNGNREIWNATALHALTRPLSKRMVCDCTAEHCSELKLSAGISKIKVD